MELFLLALAGLIASFFFAGAEAAFTNFNRIRLAAWKRKQKRFLKGTLYFTNRPENFFSTILIGNNFSSILYSTFATVFLIRYLDETTAWALLTIIVVYFGEIFPKTLFRSFADRIIVPTLTLVYGIFQILKPIIFVLNRFINIILKFFGARNQETKEYFSREELHFLLHAGTEEEEKKYISNVLQFKDVKVREAMIPRADVVAVKEGSNWDTVVELLSNQDLNFLVVFNESLDNISGVLFAYELLNFEENIWDLVRPVSYVPDNKSCAQLLREFQSKNITVAVVLDEYGGTAGIVTMDDLIDEVFGEVEAEGQIRTLNDHTWLLDARIELDILESQFELNFEDSEAETLAGYILEQTGSIPETGQEVEFDQFRIQVTKATPNRIFEIKLIKKQK